MSETTGKNKLQNYLGDPEKKCPAAPQWFLNQCLGHAVLHFSLHLPETVTVVVSP